MPPVIGALASAAVGAAGIGSAVILPGLTVGGLVSALATTAATFALQSLLSPKGKKSVRQDQVTVKESDARRLSGYGRVKTGGSTVALSAYLGSVLTIGIVHCEGPIDAYEEWWLNDSKTAIPSESIGGFAGIPPWIGLVVMQSHLGTVDQEVNPTLSIFVPGWTADHRLKGLAYTVQLSRLPPKPDKYFQLSFPDGNPTLRVVMRLRPVLDIRTGVTTWSQNAALCIRDFVTTERTDQVNGRTWCYINASRIDDAMFAAFADVCDQAVPLAAGGTEPRYRLDGMFSRDEEPRDVLRRMLATCDAELVALPTGKIGIRGGVWEEPTVTLTEEMFLAYEYQAGHGRADAVNSLRWKFTDAKNDYRLIEGDPWDDEDDQEERGELLTDSAEIEMVQSHTQGRRLMKIAMAKANPRHLLRNCVVQLPALALLGERVVRVRHATLEIDEVFRVERFEPAGDLSTVSLDLASIRSDAYEWDPEAEEGTPPANPIDGLVIGRPPDAQGVNLLLMPEILNGEMQVVRIVATVSEPAEGYTLIGRYRYEGGGDDAWEDMLYQAPGVVVTPYVGDGFRYEVQVAWSGVGGIGDWSPSQSILATADQTPPAVPTEFTAEGREGAVALAWRAPGSANTRKVRLYRVAGEIAPIEDATEVLEVVLGPNQSFAVADVDRPPGPYRYWIRAVNGSGIEGDYAGPLDVVVT